MVDIEGKELKVGDDVIVATGYYGDLHKCIISKLTPKSVYIKSIQKGFERLCSSSSKIYKLEKNVDS